MLSVSVYSMKEPFGVKAVKDPCSNVGPSSPPHLTTSREDGFQCSLIDSTASVISSVMRLKEHSEPATIHTLSAHIAWQICVLQSPSLKKNPSPLSIHRPIKPPMQCSRTSQNIEGEATQPCFVPLDIPIGPTAGGSGVSMWKDISSSSLKSAAVANG